MAMNPMQRRARTSFIMGFLVALIIGALVVVALLIRIKGINEAKEALEALQKQVYVATADIESGAEVSLEDFSMGTVQTKMDASLMISADDFEFTNEDGEIDPKYDEDGNQLAKTMIMKIDVPAGTIITKDMLEEVDDQLQDSQRIQEFNMINLPSQLKNGQYVDVRMSFPNGQDFVVLSKKKVIGTNATSIWLKLNELEISLMNNAIVESYTGTGIRLYALPYIEAGRQKEAIPTYVASTDVMNLMGNNPNILEEAQAYYANSISGTIGYRASTIEPMLDPTREQRNELVSAGNANEQQTVRALRQTFVDSLEGTEDIGYGEQ